MSVVYLKFSRVFLKGNICGGGAREGEEGDCRAAPVSGVWLFSGCPQGAECSWVNRCKTLTRLTN